MAVIQLESRDTRPILDTGPSDSLVNYNFFVSPTGGTGAGSFESPWSLAYAWGTGAGTAQGDGKLLTTGARIALRGGTGGTQVKYNVNTIVLSAGGSIGTGVDNPDGKLIWEGYRSSTNALPERACIFGTGSLKDYCMIDGDYNWLLNLEGARDWPDRNNGFNGAANIWVKGTHNGTKIAHCDLHDGGNGVYCGDADDEQEDFGRVDIYANSIRNQGWDPNGTPGSSAHGLYIHHKSGANGRMRIEENILGSTFALNCQLYDSDGPPDGHVEDIDYNGNVHFNGYTLAGTTPVNWTVDGNLLTLGGEQALVSISATDNFFAWPDNYGDVCIVAGWENHTNGVLTIIRPYCMGGGSGYGMVNIRGAFATESNLTIQDGFFRHGNHGNRGMIRVSDKNPVNGYNISGNVWVLASAGTTAFCSNNTANQYQNQTIVKKTLANWITDTGLSNPGTIQTTGDPSVTAVFVRPTTRFYNNIGNVIIYNWANLSTIPVDLSSILSNGQNYAIFDNRDIWNPIATGTYNGGTVNFSNTELTHPTPIGGYATNGGPPPSFNGKFNAYIVRRTT